MDESQQATVTSWAAALFPEQVPRYHWPDPKLPGLTVTPTSRNRHNGRPVAATYSTPCSITWIPTPVTMKRKAFKETPFAMSAPFALGIPMKVMGETMLTKLIRSPTVPTIKVLIILRLHGGNDGMNMLIPVEQYDLYYGRRPNICDTSQEQLANTFRSIPPCRFEQQVGLHPDMQAKRLVRYRQGSVCTGRIVRK